MNIYVPGLFPLTGIWLGLIIGSVLATRGDREPSLLTLVLRCLPFVVFLCLVGFVVEPMGPRGSILNTVEP